jgi:hypothetical protein
MLQYKNIDLIVIVGAQKSGTSSLFSYLSEHYQVAGSITKQSCYFMSEGYYALNKSDVPRLYSKKLEDFLSLFPSVQPDTKALVEATPDYLHTPGVLVRIKAMECYFRSVQVVAVLRHPVDRFVSWHRLSIQLNKIDSHTSLKGYYDMNGHILTAFKESDGCFFAKESGQYEQFLPQALDLFGDNLHVLSFDQLKNSPRELLTSLCNHIGLDSNYYNQYEFGVVNKTVSIRYPALAKTYLGLRRVYIFIMNSPLREAAKPIRNIISTAYHRINDTAYAPINGDHQEASYNELYEYYKETILFCNKHYNFKWKQKHNGSEKK